MDASDIALASSLLIGKKAWPLIRTHGSMFILNIGKAVLRRGYKKPHGEWMLIVEQAHWRIYKGDTLVISDSAKGSSIDRLFKEINPGTVNSFQIDAIAQSIHIKLDSMIFIEITCNDSLIANNEDQWLLYDPVASVWIAKNNEIRLEVIIN